MKRLNIFISSTCFDLSQIRVNLNEYLETSGHNPMLSEFKNFPINPSKKTLDNCISAVQNDADVFVLVVGNRYGSEIESGKSITNAEFLAAKDKGIPIYIFINKSILNVLDVWKRNKDGDYNYLVDTTKIFEFISELRDDSKLWTFEFENAQDIVSVLKIQLSYLFKESLLIYKKFNTETEDLFKERLSNEALRIILEKKELFEIDFFVQTLLDEIIKRETLKNDYKYKILLQSKYSVHDDLELINWVQQRILVIGNLIESLNKLIKNAFPTFYAEPGCPSDLKGLFYVSETYARIYESIVNWTIETSTTYVKEECIQLRDKLSNLTGKVLDELWKFPFAQREVLNQVKYRTNDETLNLNLTLTFEIEEKALEEYNKEFEKFSNRIINQKTTNYEYQ